MRCNLIDQCPVAAHIREVNWGRELPDGLDVLREGLGFILGEPDPGPVHSVLAEVELVTVQHNSILAHQREVFSNLPESSL